MEKARGCYLRGEGPMVVAIGVEDLVVVATDDVVLVANKNCDQEIKHIVKRLKDEGCTAAVSPRRVYRPWGFYESVLSGHRFQVKRITVNPGGKLSLQKHFHRAEHWVVVNGTALVTRDDEQLIVRENESVYLPLGAVHRLENPGKLPLNLIEVQSGAYLQEDDIVRLEDVYQRT
jgi:mannose-1-phosphate guanylyltransferase/mannose-1-phosphate guanylyltransferase/mannose-6-phosphate isomerase